MKDLELGVVATVIGEIRPYAIKDEETGELVSGLSLRVPGGAVSLSLDVEVVERMKDGEIWRVTGSISGTKKGTLRLYAPTELQRLRAAQSSTGPKIVWDVPADGAAKAARS